MKILVAQFVTESNANIPFMTDIENYTLAFNENALPHMNLGDVFEKAGAEVIGSVYANGFSGGVVVRNAFDYIENRILADVKENLKDLDGLFLHLHGASEVEGLEGGSGDFHILHEIRKIVGPYMPIVVACDPHGNLKQEYVDETTIIRSYRESPHTDLAETVQKCCGFLVDLINNRRNIKPEYIKLPLILGGEQSVSADEPVLSINQYMDEMETDPRILSASWHVGYIRHDCDCAGCGVIVVPNDENDQLYAKEKAKELAKFVWDRHEEFHYTGLTKEPEEALKLCLEVEGKPAFLTDSGDNCTSGAVAANTFVLRQVLALEDMNGKSFLFGTIHDPVTNEQLLKMNIGEKTHISLGMELDELSSKVELDVTLKAIGDVEGGMGYSGNYGKAALVSVDGKDIDIIVAPNSYMFIELHQFEAIGAKCEDYDVVVVKQGYIFPELKALGVLSVMSLTDGATLQDTSKLPFKRIMRPMYPIDKI